MKGTDLSEKQLKAAEQFILLIHANSNDAVPDPLQIVSIPWENLVRLVAFYGTVRASSMLNGGSVEEPGEVYKPTPRQVATR